MKRCLILLLPLAILSAVVHLGANGSSGTGSVALSNSSPIVQTFDSLTSSGSTPSTTLPVGWYLAETGGGTAADGAYVVGNGSSNGGNAYSFGAASAVDRALGSVGSGSVTAISYGARLLNSGSGPITSLTISYNGELWRRGPSTIPDGLTFTYSTDATDFATGTFTGVAALAFASPGNACATVASATDGNSAACRTAVSATIPGLSVNPGSAIWIKWTDTDAQGSDDGVAIDDVSVTATFSNAPTPPTTTGSATPNPASPGQLITLAGSISPGFNPLSSSYTVACDLSPVGGSIATTLPNNGSTFSSQVSIAANAPLGAAPLHCSVTDDLQRSSSFDIALIVLLPLNSTCGAPATPIAAAQGSSALGPLAGQIVDVEAVVTGDFQGSSGLSGFYIEASDSEQDGNPATSEGLFVFSSAPVNSGDRVRVRGSMAEFSSATGALVSKLTELSGVTSVQICSTGNTLPTPIDVALPIDSVASWERYEGMVVRFTQPLVVTGNFNLGAFGQIDLAPQVLYTPTETPGTPVTWAAATDLVARSRIALDDASNQVRAAINGGTVAPYPPPGLSDANTLRVGARVNPSGSESTPLVGVLDDRFGSYRIQPTDSVTFSNDTNPRPDTAATAAAAGARFRVVSANVLNYFTTLGSRGAATTDELTHQRAKLVAEMTKAGGDIFGLSELQNFANGQTNGGTYTNAAVADLTSALATATGRNYRFIDTIDSSKLASGNAVTSNGTDAIRSGLIYDADAVTPVGFAALYYQNDQNRPSLAQTFRPASGIHPERQTFTVVVNHFRSKGSACGIGNDDIYQGNCNGMRLLMANNVALWLSGNPTSDPAGIDRRYIVIGDFNAYLGEAPIQSLISAGYTNLIDLLIGSQAYSYNFDSQAGYLDHALVNEAALRLVKAVAELHVNADEPSALQALDSVDKSASAQAEYFAPNEFAASDHDPIVIGFNPLLGDFTDDGVLDEDDRRAILGAIPRGHSGKEKGADRRMDLDGDGQITQDDFHIWQQLFIAWKQGRK